MGENLNEVYDLSNLHQSRRISGGVRKIGQQRWGLNASVNFVNYREESDEEEEEDIEEDEPNDDLDVTSDEGLKRYEDMNCSQDQARRVSCFGIVWGNVF